MKQQLIIHGSTFNSQLTHPSGSVGKKYPLFEYFKSKYPTDKTFRI